MSERSEHGLESIALKIKEITIRVLDLEIDPKEIADDELLLGGGLEVDSLGIMHLVDELEVEFGIEVSDEEVSAELFRSVESLTSFVAAKINPSVQSSAQAS